MFFFVFFFTVYQYGIFHLLGVNVEGVDIILLMIIHWEYVSHVNV